MLCYDDDVVVVDNWWCNFWMLSDCVCMQLHACACIACMRVCSVYIYILLNLNLIKKKTTKKIKHYIQLIKEFSFFFLGLTSGFLCTFHLGIQIFSDFNSAYFLRLLLQCMNSLIEKSGFHLHLNWLFFLPSLDLLFFVLNL